MDDAYSAVRHCACVTGHNCQGDIAVVSSPHRHRARHPRRTKIPHRLAPRGFSVNFGPGDGLCMRQNLAHFEWAHSI